MNNESLLPRQQAFERHDFKVASLLSFLSTERWSHQNILQQLLGLKSRQGIHKTLVSMEAKGLIKRHTIESGFGAPLTIWGITTHGVMMSFGDNETPKDIRAFERSKLKRSQINHTLDTQLVRVRSQAAGWTGWRTAGFVRKGIKAPDAIACRPDGVIVAFEIERTLKALRRYPDILISHLSARKQGLWNEVYYLMPDTSMKKRVQRCFDVIKTARYQKQTIQITAAHKTPFKFFTYEELWEVNHQEEKQNGN